MDPQANLTDHLGVELDEDDLTVYDVLIGREPRSRRSSCATATEGLVVLPADEDLAAAEQELAG